jgi:predicted enzyme related to lactoylglutathione lyase
MLKERPMRVLQTTLVACLLVSATAAFAQESGIRVRSVRVLATDPEAIATFYKKAFGMSETRRVGDTPGSTFKEIILNTGSTPDLAKKSKDVAIVIATRPKDAPAGAMASLILEVPDLNKAIETAKTAGGSVMRPPGKSGDLMFAFLKDPDGNQVELVMSPK